MQAPSRKRLRPGIARLSHLICNFACILRISVYGLSDLLSSLYAALARTGDLRTEISSYTFQGFLRARDTALADAGFLFLANSLQEVK